MKKLLSFLLVLIILVAVGVGGYFAVVNKQINLNDFIAIGQTRGVDVSSYQEDVDFKKFAEQGISFAYIKATEGASHVDESFKEKWQAVGDTEIVAGAYHYFSYKDSGAKQAENFIETVGDLKGRLIPAVDMELTVEEVYKPPEKEAVVKGLKAFLAVVEEKYDVKPLIYCKKDYYDTYLADDFSDYPLWVRNTWYPIWADFSDNWYIWQYNDRGQLDGYSGEKFIDYNMLNFKYRLDDLKIK
jgi:lysozyme